MSGPTKGMVAGQAIITNAQTKEFDEGYSRIFGDRKPERGRFVMRGGKLVSVDEAWEEEYDAHVPVVTDRHMENDRAIDGTDISNRTRRRNYMKANGLADASDYTQHLEKKRKEREAHYAGTYGGQADRELHNTIGRALYEAKKRRR